MWGEELYGSYSPPTHTQVARQTDRHTSSKRSRRERDTPADRDKSCEVETLQITVGADGDTYNHSRVLRSLQYKKNSVSSHPPFYPLIVDLRIHAQNEDLFFLIYLFLNIVNERICLISSNF